VLINVCVTPNPEPAEAPVSEAELVETVQSNEVPAILLSKVIPVVPPEQKVSEAGVAVAIGKGLTVITTVVDVADAQPLADGVIVYVSV
jgi:hypothetical protein